MRMRVPPCRPSIVGRLSPLVLLVPLLILGHAGSLAAQTPMVPYFGKNNIHYDTFDWHIYTTDHFEIYYYPELEQHLERVAGYAESAYQQVSSDLKHDLSFKVPLILFKTHSEFEQQNVIPGAAQEGVGAFAEPFRDRMLLPIDDPPDRLYGLIAHELTHIFEFDIIPQSLIRRSVPLWVNEGLSDYERGAWTPLDLMTIRDAAVADIVPKMTELEGYGNTNNPRLIYNLGHAVFEFIEAKYGKEGIRQYPVRPAQERHRRRRGRLRRSVPDEAGRVRSGVRALSEGALQAVPRQGAARRLRARPGAERGEDRLRRSAQHRAVTVRRSDRDGHRQPQGRRARHRPGLVEGRRGGPKPDARLRQELRVRPHRAARRAVQHDAVDVVVAEGRSARLLRPHREGTHADRAERADPQGRSANPDEVGGRARVAELLARRPDGRVLGAARRHRRHLHASIWTTAKSST